MTITNHLGMWRVQVGKGRSSYRDKYTFASDQPVRAYMHYECLNTHSGHKKRLVNPDGKVVLRQLT
jgi:hypothetical protein